MYAYIKGKITHRTPTEIYLETSNGVGYYVHISLNTYSALQDLEEVKIYTYFHVKEDNQSLYGFFEEQEKEIFIKMLSVSGIGPNTARIIVSSMTAEEIVNAIATDNHVRFGKVKGIGPKTAKRIILDLKDKMTKEIANADLKVMVSNNSARDEALSALVTLGFPKNMVEKALNSILKDTDGSSNSEMLIKAVLKKLS